MLKLIILTLFKESYLLLVNSYGFLVHPYLTLKRIGRDRSQIAIFFSLWLGVWLGTLLIVGLTIFLMPHFFPNLIWFKNLGFGLGIASFAFLLFFTFYLFYWFLKVRKNFYESGT